MNEAVGLSPQCIFTDLESRESTCCLLERGAFSLSERHNAHTKEGVSESRVRCHKAFVIEGRG